MLLLRLLNRCSVLGLIGLALAGCAHAPSTASGGPASGQGGYKVGKPYEVDGVWYYPAVDWSYDETGIASWYGAPFHGHFTANGEIYDANGLTAAHRTLPLPTIVQVTNLENGRTIAVRVNDRGPFARGRIIDLSRRAAQLLGFEASGTAKVKVKILVADSIQAVSLARRNGGGGTLLAAADMPRPDPVAPVVAAVLPPLPGTRVAAAPAEAARPRPALPPRVPAEQPRAVAPPVLVPTVHIVPVSPTQIYIQAGAFTQVGNAVRAKNRLAVLGPVRVTDVRTQGISLYRVRLGPISSVEEADRLLGRVVGAGLPGARIVVD